MAAAITVYPNQSPRLIKIASPTTSITVQELTDLIKGWEDEPANLSYPKLVRTTGKEDLGGGVLVGITAELQDAQVLFEARGGSDSAGTATTPNADGNKLIDSSATFITDGIVPGDSIINLTDASVATVRRVVSETEIEHFFLEDGTDNDWDAADSYKIWNKVACEVNGGNLVAVDANGDPALAFLPSAFTHVTRTSASSATLQEQADIQYSSFLGAVHLDVANGTAGTAFPYGTPRQKVNNIADAITIANVRGFNTIQVYGDITLDATAALNQFTVRGESPIHSTITVNAAAAVTDTIFENCTVTGALDGNNVIKDAHIQAITYFNGAIHDCLLENATITLAGGADAHIINCWSGVIGASSPVIDMGGSGQTLGLRGYSGGIKLTNKTGSEDVSLDFESGRLTVDSTVTNGTIYVRGIVEVINNSTGSTVIQQEAAINIPAIDAEVDEAKIAILTQAFR